MKYKTEINDHVVLKVLIDTFDDSLKGLKEVQSGHIKKVYFFLYNEEEYVIRFSHYDLEFKFEKYLYQYGNKNIVAKPIKIGSYQNLYYMISKKIMGQHLKALDEKSVIKLIPKVLYSITHIHQININESVGYGWLDDDFNGCFSSLKLFIESHFNNEQKGFWKDWYHLFQEGILNWDQFHFFYKRMINLEPYCKGIRHIVHGDFHLSNIIYHKNEISGFIDWGNVLYGDFLLDIATIHMQLPQLGILNQAINYYQNNNIKIDYFKERFTCMSLFKGLDMLRFSAKQGNISSCKSIINSLEQLIII